MRQAALRRRSVTPRPQHIPPQLFFLVFVKQGVTTLQLNKGHYSFQADAFFDFYPPSEAAGFEFSLPLSLVREKKWIKRRELWLYYCR
jgi:hypothetical protein